MSRETTWEFLDDRGHRTATPRRPERVVAYVQAAASLWDHGLRPVGIFGSQHDGDSPDRAKSGALPLEELRYLGAGSGVRTDEVRAARPDLLVTVTYDGKQTYGLDSARSEELEEHIPTVALGVGPGHSLSAVRERFSALARALGMSEAGPGEAELEKSARRLRTAAAGAPRTRVLALSPAGQDKVHLARPGAWPDLLALAEHGVGMVQPPSAPSPNWSTTGWEEAAALEPGVVLHDVRGNAVPLAELRQSEGWRALESRATLVPWNPELPCSALAHAGFSDLVAAELEGLSGRG